MCETDKNPNSPPRAIHRYRRPIFPYRRTPTYFASDLRMDSGQWIQQQYTTTSLSHTRAAGNHTHAQETTPRGRPLSGRVSARAPQQCHGGEGRGRSRAFVIHTHDEDDPMVGNTRKEGKYAYTFARERARERVIRPHSGCKGRVGCTCRIQLVK